MNIYNCTEIRDNLKNTEAIHISTALSRFFEPFLKPRGFGSVCAFGDHGKVHTDPICGLTV